jgi:hypothetical protein
MFGGCFLRLSLCILPEKSLQTPCKVSGAKGEQMRSNGGVIEREGRLIAVRFVFVLV